MFDAEDIRTAYRTGHEIACHTFTHLDCAHATKSSIRAEVSSNAAALSTLTDGFMPTNFAYPYGSVSEVAKRVLGARFSSCRGVQPGINRETADLAELLANRIYAGHFDETHLRQLIDHAASASGWLIFYTHDVIDPPSPYGCTPEQLETIIAYAAQRTTILPVRDVVSRTAPSPPQRCTRGE
jgi:peptidoglycan/xylan/chitin deacetylase (PgdA/CDA1 family)